MEPWHIPWERAERELRAHRCEPVGNRGSLPGEWWRTPRGTEFFVQWVNAQRDVDTEAFRQQMQLIDDQRRSLS